jgi:hypothetical protein
LKTPYINEFIKTVKLFLGLKESKRKQDLIHFTAAYFVSNSPHNMFTSAFGHLFDLKLAFIWS